MRISLLGLDFVRGLDIAVCEVRHVGSWLVGWLAAVGWQVGCVGEGGADHVVPGPT